MGSSGLPNLSRPLTLVLNNDLNLFRRAGRVPSLRDPISIDADKQSQVCLCAERVIVEGGLYYNPFSSSFHCTFYSCSLSTFLQR